MRNIYHAFFQHGYCHAMMCMVVAVLVNHIRRVLTPWLGGFFILEIVADMKMARSVPHYFVQQSLGFPWQWFFVWLGISYILQTAMEPLAEAAAVKTRGPVWRILWLTLTIAGAEHAYAHACWTAAHIYAHGTLILYGGSEEQGFMQSLLDANPVRAAVLLGLVVWGLHHYLVPMATKMPRGRWAAGVLYALISLVTARVVRYSNYYFIALEVSDMLGTFCWFGVGLVVVCVEALRDRLQGKDTASGQVASGGVKPGSVTSRRI